jgi:two-component system, NarL family, sensor kinase
LESKEGIDVITIVVLGSLGMLTLVSFIIVFIVLYQKRMLFHKAQIQEKDNKHQRQLLDASIEVAEQERQKIAANIHDDVGLMLSTIKLNFTRINRNLKDTALVDELLRNNASMLDETINVIRSISHDLMPQALLKMGYVRGLKEMCNQINNAGIIKAELSSDDPVISIAKKDELQLYRMVKEVTNNIIKHAGASEIKINVTCTGSLLNTVVSHDGKGISTVAVEELANSGKGIGLKSILSRAQLTGSVIQYLNVGKESKIVIDTPIYGNKEN